MWVMKDSCFSNYVRSNLYILFKAVKCKKAGISTATEQILTDRKGRYTELVCFQQK